MHEPISDDRIHRIDWQAVDLRETDLTGAILDIGGGGEGVIGQYKGSQVTAIDIRRDELEEAPPGGVKVVMDARKLAFVDSVFDTATSFFAMMYFDREDLLTVFREVHRVLKPSGCFYLWEVKIPPRRDSERDIFMVPVEATLPDRVIKTAYGCPWEKRMQDVLSMDELLLAAGFIMKWDWEIDSIFHACYKKT